MNRFLLVVVPESRPQGRRSFGRYRDTTQSVGETRRIWGPKGSGSERSKPSSDGPLVRERGRPDTQVPTVPTPIEKGNTRVVACRDQVVPRPNVLE